MNKIEKTFGKTHTNVIYVSSSLYAQKFYEKMGYKKSTGIRKKKGFVYQPMKKIL